MVEMKKVWSRPLTVVQNFEANEYVAACGDKGTVYKFKCDAGEWYGGDVYLETNGKPGLQIAEWGVESDKPLGGYHRCGKEHEAATTDDFLDGYFIPYGSLQATSVIVWRGSDGQNVHCTTILNKDDWETSKS